MDRRQLAALALFLLCSVGFVVGMWFIRIFPRSDHSPLNGNDGEPSEQLVQNIILMIGDGMGIGHLNATRKSLGPTETLNLDSFPLTDLVNTQSSFGLVTDSAAAATALATGVQTLNGYISMTTAGTLLTILEFAESMGKSTGLVTTTRLTHATPACFAAHVTSRNQEVEIGRQMLLEHEVEVLLGGGRTQLEENLDDAQATGYILVESRSQFLEANDATKLLGVFTSSHMSYEEERNTLLEPSLAEMTNQTLQMLSRNEQGFFLMVEGGRIDHAAHANNITNVIGDTKAFDAAVGVALQFAEEQGETLLIVTADHETGGLIVNMSNPELDYEWTTTVHTSDMVQVFTYCQNTSIVPDYSHHVDTGQFLFTAFGSTSQANERNLLDIHFELAVGQMQRIRDHYKLSISTRKCLPDVY